MIICTLIKMTAIWKSIIMMGHAATLAVHDKHELARELVVA